MDPRAFTKKGYDTDLLILRTLFALNPNTNLPISSFYVATTDGIGGLYWLSAIDYISAATGVGNLPSSIVSLSTGLSSINGNFTNLSTYVSSVIVQGISSLSTALGNIDLTGTIVPRQLTSSIIGLGTSRYISSLSLQSTVAGLGSASYISSATLSNYTASSFVSSFTWLLNDTRYISTGNLLSTSSNFLYRFENLGVLNPNTVNVFGTLNLTGNTIGTVNNYQFADSNLISSLEGLGNLGYISTLSLTSTLEGLGTAGFLSTISLISSIDGLATYGYISSLTFKSSIEGLATTGYISSLSLLSTVTGLGTLGYISSQGATQTA